MVPGQVKVADRSNDAPRGIAAKITDKGADYVRALKGIRPGSVANL